MVWNLLGSVMEEVGDLLALITFLAAAVSLWYAWRGELEGLARQAWANTVAGLTVGWVAFAAKLLSDTPGAPNGIAEWSNGRVAVTLLLAALLAVAAWWQRRRTR